MRSLDMYGIVLATLSPTTMAPRPSRIRAATQRIPASFSSISIVSPWTGNHPSPVDTPPDHAGRVRDVAYRPGREALKLRRPLPDDRLEIVPRGRDPTHRRRTTEFKLDELSRWSKRQMTLRDGQKNSVRLSRHVCLLRACPDRVLCIPPAGSLRSSGCLGSAEVDRRL
jgi:hypothetical protein